MFIGSFYHSIQVKGRLAIPAAFRKDLDDKPILTRGIDTCLYLLPFKIWTRTLRKLDISPLGSQDERDLLRLLSHNATRANFDPQGRILIPTPLKQWAKLAKKVVIAGSVDWVEIWDLKTYHAHLDSINGKSTDIVERLKSHHQT